MVLISCTLAWATGGFAAELNPDHDAALQHLTVTMGSTSVGRKLLETGVSHGPHLRSLQQGGAAEEFDKDCWYSVGEHVQAQV